MSNAPSLLQVGQTWRLQGKTDQGRTFQATLTLGQPSQEQAEDLKTGMQRAAGTGRVATILVGTQAIQPDQSFMLMVNRQGEMDTVLVLPDPSAEAADFGLNDDLTFCFLLPEAVPGRLSGLSLRLREPGEKYSVSGTVSDQGSEREQTLDTLRSLYTPLFGVGSCTLTRG